MNPLERTPIEKAGYSHGWENVRESNPQRVVLYSARHKAEALVTPTDVAMIWQLTFPKGPPTSELVRTLPEQHFASDTFQATTEASLGRLLRRAAELAMSLPNQAAERFAADVAQLDANPPTHTEVLALVKQRRGQDLFRAALLDYWGGACAVTGLAMHELLRASHAKSWALCQSDSERLNVFNGLLLAAPLDALFDGGLIAFSATGQLTISPALDEPARQILGLAPPSTCVGSPPLTSPSSHGTPTASSGIETASKQLTPDRIRRTRYQSFHVTPEFRTPNSGPPIICAAGSYQGQRSSFTLI